MRRRSLSPPGTRESSVRSAVALSFRFKVVASVSLLLIGVSAAVAVALIRYERFFLEREGQKRVRALAASLAASARDPLLVGDELRLGPVVAAAMENEDVVGAYVTDEDGVIVFHSDSRWIGKAVSALPPQAGGDVLRAITPVVVEGTVIGSAVVVLASRFIERALRATVRGLLVPLGVGTMIALGGTLLLTGLHVRRIEKLDRAVQALGEGNRAVRVPLAGNDEVARLAAHFNRMVEQLDAARQELEEGFTETVGALAAAIEANDPYTRGHCERVALLSCAIARHLGMDEVGIRKLELAAILHDVGKIGVPADILGKAGRLSGPEIESMRRHPEIGARILAPLSFLGDVPNYVRHHHEDYDGSGYPEQLAGEEIPLAARIIHLVDAYDAMISSRPYRRALPHREAMRRLAADSGRQFDPDLVATFVELEGRGVVRAVYDRVSEVATA